eukprot:12072612-Ditylum_brightwellii.AAC.1
MDNKVSIALQQAIKKEKMSLNLHHHTFIKEMPPSGQFRHSSIISLQAYAMCIWGSHYSYGTNCYIKNA